MENPVRHKLLNPFGFSTLMGGLGAVLISVAGLSGWVLKLPLLTSFGHNYIPMAISTCIVLLVAGTILIVHLYQIVRKDGATGWMFDSMRIVRDQTGKITHFEGVAEDITEYKRAEQEKEELIAKLREALASVQTLSGLLPICSHCKKIRNDEGYWQQIESYIHQHSGTQFSHGICPDCLKKHYSQFLGDKLDSFLKRSQIGEGKADLDSGSNALPE